jgi:hypothetical protein
MSAKQIIEDRDLNNEFLEEVVLQNIKIVPENLSDWFFYKSIEDVFSIELANFNKEDIAKKLYSAYMVGASVGINVGKNKVKNRNKK